MEVDESMTSEPSVEEANFKCNFCDNEFEEKIDLMKHRKKYHVANVPSCEKFENGTCYLNESQCWYKHTHGQQKKKEDNAKHQQPQQQSSPVKQQQVFQEVSENPFLPDPIMQKMMEAMNILCIKVEQMEKRMAEMMN